MQWVDEGIVLGTRQFGESSVILELFTRCHGRTMGLVPGGRSKTKSALLQGGNVLHAVWRARLDEHLGTYQVEPVHMRSHNLLGAPLALYGFMSIAALLRYLPERDPHEDLFETVYQVLEHLGEHTISPLLFIRLELAFLSEAGFGLDLTECAATGTQQNLVYVSPRTGRAVCAEAGEPYKQRLLKLPWFLNNMTLENISSSDLQAGFLLTEHFLKRWIFEPRGVACPRERARFIALAMQNC